MQQRLESISKRYTCGDLLFDESHPLGKVVVQKQSLTCASSIEKGYYQNKGRILKLKPICFYYGDKGSADHLWGSKELREKNMTDSYPCFSLREVCHNKGKEAGKTGGKRDEMQRRKESQARRVEAAA